MGLTGTTRNENKKLYAKNKNLKNESECS